MRIIGGLWLMVLLAGCQTLPEIERYGKHYREYQDLQSLERVVALLAEEADTTRIKQLLGDPIDMGFDYRYTVDSVGPNGCTLGAVFHLDGTGGFDQKWVGEICE